LYKIYKTDKYKFYKEYDKLISILCRKICNNSEIVKNILKYYNLSLLLELANSNLLVYHGCSTEFIKKEGLNLLNKIILNEFPILGLEIIKQYTQNELDDLNDNIQKELAEKLLTNDIEFDKIANSILISPYAFQQEILNNCIEFYKLNDVGKLIWACGLGKTFMSLFIVNLFKCKNIIIGCPTIPIQNQFGKRIKQIFPNSEILYIGSEGTTIRDEIETFLFKSTDKIKFIISTYSSCHKLLFLKDKEFIFDFKIGDEAHHLVCFDADKDIKVEKSYKKFHNIKSYKTLFMTATEKIIDVNNDKKIYSMDDESQFGKYLDVRTFCWAIDNHFITDYKVLIIENTLDEINNIINKLNIKNIELNKSLFISSFMTLKAMTQYNNITHGLIYTNTIQNADIVNEYINQLIKLFNIPKDTIYNNSLHSHSSNDTETEHMKFNNSKYGIISCVYKFGEGFDEPKINFVVIAENMESEVRIVQASQRGNRIDANNPDKVSFIIMPYISDWNDNENTSFKKCRSVISKLRNVDEKIEQRINVIRLEQLNNITNKEVGNNNTSDNINLDMDLLLKEDKNGLSKIKLKLLNSRALINGLTEEQNEYNYMKEINKSLNLQSKNDYFNSKNKHNDFIENPEEYFKKKCVWTNWYDFIGNNTIIKTKEEWIKICKEKNIQTEEQYFKECKIDKKLPIDPSEFYLNFTNLTNELGLNKRRK